MFYYSTVSTVIAFDYLQNITVREKLEPIEMEQLTVRSNMDTDDREQMDTHQAIQTILGQ